jgi:hypothetical protein
MNRNGLIVLQAVGALSILAYPAVLVANIMSIAAPGHTFRSSLPWVLLSLYPVVWILLDVFAWRAMAGGAVRLAFGLSSIPVLACLLVAGIFAFGWIGFLLGTAGIGNGGLHVKTYPSSNVLLDSISRAAQDTQRQSGPSGAVAQALRDIDANPTLLNVSTPAEGSPLNVVLNKLSISLDGTINGDIQLQQDRVRLVRALVARGGHLNKDEATDLRKTWVLRRALYEGPVTTATENPLVWRIVTHDRGDSMRFNPFTDKLPPRRDRPAGFLLKEDEIPLLNRATRLHGTPLYAALLDNAIDVCSVIIRAGGRLSPEEEHDSASMAALEDVFAREVDLRLVYNGAPKSR